MDKGFSLKDILLISLTILLIIGYFPKIKDKFNEKNDILEVNENTHINPIVNQEIPTIHNQIYHDENNLIFSYRAYTTECNGVCFRIKIYNDTFCTIYTNDSKKEIALNLTLEEIKFISEEMIKNNIFKTDYEDSQFCPETNGGYRIFFSDGKNARTISNMNCGQNHLPESVNNEIKSIFKKNDLSIKI